MLILDDVIRKFSPDVSIGTVSLEVPSGQMVGVIGRSGAGKSTLLRMINRMVDPTSGRILFEGKDVTGLKGAELRAWRRRCAMIFQQFNLIDRLDVITNVLTGRLNGVSLGRAIFKAFSPPERALAIRALDRLGMTKAALQKADTLSGGQQQRVAIARALMQEPEIILADEPIASLDPHNAKVVMDALRQINRQDGITVFCNLHTLATAKNYCDRIVGMAKGKVVFDGRPDELSDVMVHRIYGPEGVETDDPFGPDSVPVPQKTVHPATV